MFIDVYSEQIPDVINWIKHDLVPRDSTFISLFGISRRSGNAFHEMSLIKKHFNVIYDSGYTIHNYNHPEDPYNRQRLVIYELKDEMHSL